MIYFEKINECYLLAEEFYKKNGNAINIEINQCFGCRLDSAFNLYIDQKKISFQEIDDLIDHLKVLTNAFAQQYFKKDEIVWFWEYIGHAEDGGLDLQDLYLNEAKIIAGDEVYDVLPINCSIMRKVHVDFLYKTKADAIAAMLERITDA